MNKGNAGDHRESTLQKSIAAHIDSKTNDQAFEDLEFEIQSLKDRLKEERFLSFILILLFFNTAIIQIVENIGAALLLGIPQIILILVLAEKWHIDIIFTWLRDLINRRKNMNDE